MGSNKHTSNQQAFHTSKSEETMKSSTLIVAIILVAQAVLIMGVFAAVSIENSMLVHAVGRDLHTLIMDICLIFSCALIVYILCTRSSLLKLLASEIKIYLTDLDERVRSCRCGAGGEGGQRGARAKGKPGQPQLLQQLHPCWFKRAPRVPGRTRG